MRDHTEIFSLMPRICPITEDVIKTPPTSPIAGMSRGTRLDRYIRYPSRRAFIAGMRVPPIRNAALYVPTNEAPLVRSAVESAPAAAPTWCRDASERRLTTPVRSIAPSMTREVTNPSARASFWRLTTGYSVMAVPMPASATITSMRAPQRRPASLPELRM